MCLFNWLITLFICKACTQELAPHAQYKLYMFESYFFFSFFPEATCLSPHIPPSRLSLVLQWTMAIFLASPHFICTATIIRLCNFHIFLGLRWWPLPSFSWAFIWSTGSFLHMRCKLAEIGTFHHIGIQCLAQSSIWSQWSSAFEVFQSIWNWQQNLTLLVYVNLASSICFSICLRAV